jgi:hypothetical protein
MIAADARSERAFKTAWFAKAALKARIGDEELCSALRQAMQGQADDLGGGVFKKRPGRNRFCAIILAIRGRFWVFEYLYAKKDRANIDSAELADFRKLAKGYSTLSDRQVDQLTQHNDWVEIHDGGKA